jgi:hypothetical protein
VLSESPEEVVCPRTLEHENVTDASLDVNWDHIVRLFDLLELRVHQGLIKVKYQSLLASAVFRLWT